MSSIRREKSGALIGVQCWAMNYQILSSAASNVIHGNERTTSNSKCKGNAVLPKVVKFMDFTIGTNADSMEQPESTIQGGGCITQRRDATGHGGIWRETEMLQFLSKALDHFHLMESPPKVRCCIAKRRIQRTNALKNVNSLELQTD